VLADGVHDVPGLFVAQKATVRGEDEQGGIIVACS
jgi:hypothetical protein